MNNLQSINGKVMKQHYKVWVYDNCGVATVESRDYSIAVSEQENVIVLTIEELSELWNAGHRGGYSDAGQKTRLPAVDFETYLTSKGINIL